MRQASRRNYIVYLTALSLLLSVVENSLPRPVPFFRLGFANLPLLWALSSLSFPEYISLALGKWICGSFVSGTLISPFALMGLGNTLSSALVMYLLYTLSKGRISRYLISQIGAMTSAFVQLYIASFILTESIMRLLPLMLVVNEVCGLVIAYISYRFEIPANIEVTEDTEKGKHNTPILILYVMAIFSLCLTGSLPLLAIMFVLAIIACPVSGRRVFWSMYVITFVSVTLFNLLVPQGRVLFFFITEGALEDGLTRALRLIALTALSQSFAASGALSLGYVGKVMGLSSRMISSFYESEGKLFERIEAALKATGERKEADRGKRHTALLALLLILITSLATLQAVLL